MNKQEKQMEANEGTLRKRYDAVLGRDPGPSEARIAQTIEVRTGTKPGIVLGLISERAGQGTKEVQGKRMAAAVLEMPRDHRAEGFVKGIDRKVLFAATSKGGAATMDNEGATVHVGHIIRRCMEAVKFGHAVDTDKIECLGTWMGVGRQGEGPKPGNEREWSTRILALCAIGSVNKAARVVGRWREVEPGPVYGECENFLWTALACAWKRSAVRLETLLEEFEPGQCGSSRGGVALRRAVERFVTGELQAKRSVPVELIGKAMLGEDLHRGSATVEALARAEGEEEKTALAIANRLAMDLREAPEQVRRGPQLHAIAFLESKLKGRANSAMAIANLISDPGRRIEAWIGTCAGACEAGWLTSEMLGGVQEAIESVIGEEDRERKGGWAEQAVSYVSTTRTPGADRTGIRLVIESLEKLAKGNTRAEICVAAALANNEGRRATTIDLALDRAWAEKRPWKHSDIACELVNVAAGGALVESIDEQMREAQTEERKSEIGQCAAAVIERYSEDQLEANEVGVALDLLAAATPGLDEEQVRKLVAGIVDAVADPSLGE